MSKEERTDKIEKICDRLMGIDTLIDIRNDFFDIYMSTLLKSKLKKRVNRECDYWYSKSIQVGAYSESYDPNKDLIIRFKIMKLLWRIIGCVGIVGYFKLESLFIMLTPIPAVLELFTTVLSKDTALTQHTNKKIKYNISDLLEFKKRNQYQICSAFIWNNSLMHKNMIMILQMLRLLKTLLPDYIYRIIIEGFKINTTFYLDHNKSLIGSPVHTEYLDLKNRFKRRIKHYFRN